MNSLLPPNDERSIEAAASQSDPPHLQQPPQRYTPAKKLRARKVKSPQADNPSKTRTGDRATSNAETCVQAKTIVKSLFHNSSSASSESVDGENIAPLMNQMSITSTGCASLLGILSIAPSTTQPSIQSASQPTSRRAIKKQSSRTASGVCDSLLALVK